MPNKCRTHIDFLWMLCSIFLPLPSCSLHFIQSNATKIRLQTKMFCHLFYFFIEKKNVYCIAMNCGKWYVVRCAALWHSNNNSPENCSVGECVWHEKSICIEFCWNRVKQKYISSHVGNGHQINRYNVYTLYSVHITCYTLHRTIAIFAGRNMWCRQFFRPLQIVFHLFTSQWNFLFVFRCWDFLLFHRKWLVSLIQLKLIQLCISIIMKVHNSISIDRREKKIRCFGDGIAFGNLLYAVFSSPPPSFFIEALKHDVTRNSNKCWWNFARNRHTEIHWFTIGKQSQKKITY